MGQIAKLRRHVGELQDALARKRQALTSRDEAIAKRDAQINKIKQERDSAQAQLNVLLGGEQSTGT